MKDKKQKIKAKQCPKKLEMRYSVFSAVCALFLIFNLSFLISAKAFAAFEMHPASARLPGRGGWSIADDSLSSLDNSALSFDQFNWEAGRVNFYGISELNGGFLSLQIPSENNSINFIYSTLKFSSVYRESIYSFALARPMTKNLNAGLRLNAYQIDITDFEDGIEPRTLYSDYDFALLFKDKYFNFGVSLQSLSSKSVRLKRVEESADAAISYGVMFKPVKGAVFGLDYEPGRPINGGLEVEVADALKCAIGLRQNIFTLGFSLRLPRCRLNFSALLHNDLGETYFISVSGI
ncbi:MAG: hypothetical protein COZ72_04615 [Elusimicrobia bacterium CG_4_8_14_3_um_filter_50_9]|nr:MAG: hypothetical protein COZ72_04615 [Elusimicrobia bacterium CG_4_8_14_3_um_filter_50_9]